MMETVFAVFPGIFVFVFGAVIGSFLNVCIHRMPKDESIVSPGSHCPQCKKMIAAGDNVPLLSFIFLRGKCRHCSAKIPVRYFAVELANALLWLWLWKLYGLTPLFFSGAALFSILLAVSATDLETGLIPDKLSLPGMALGLLFSAVWPVLHGQTVWFWGLAHSAAGLLAGGGILFAVGLLGNFIFRKDSMGGGDIKLLAMMGSFLGAQKAAMVFFISPFFALPLALYLKLFRKEEIMPFGPYLALAGICSYVYADIFTAFFLKIYGI